MYIKGWLIITKVLFINYVVKMWLLKMSMWGQLLIFKDGRLSISIVVIIKIINNII